MFHILREANDFSVITKYSRNKTGLNYGVSDLKVYVHFTGPLFDC